MSATVRLLAPGEETDRAVARARHEFEQAYLRRFGYGPSPDAVEKWWPLGERSAQDGGGR